MTERFDVEPLGNWTDYLNKAYGTPYLDQDRTHNRANEITQIDSSSTHVAHDAAGNMTKVPTSWWTAHYDLVWDAWNRLVEVTDGENTVAAYEHDGLGRRITETASGTTRHFYYSAAWQVLEERVGGSTGADRQFVWGARYIDDLVLRDRDTSEPKNGVLNERLYALEDANFNVVALADTGGTIQERYLYSAYGTSSALSGTFGSGGGSYAWEYLYTARRRDLATGLYYYRNRPYHHELGRFLSRDPIGYGGGDVNLYRYVGNGPLYGLDPFGLQAPDLNLAGDTLTVDADLKFAEGTLRADGYDPLRDESIGLSPIMCKCWAHWYSFEFKWVEAECRGSASKCCERACSDFSSWSGEWEPAGVKWGSSSVSVAQAYLAGDEAGKASIAYAFSKPVEVVTGLDTGAADYYEEAWETSGLEGTWTQTATDWAAGGSAIAAYTAGGLYVGQAFGAVPRITLGGGTAGGAAAGGGAGGGAGGFTLGNFGGEGVSLGPVYPNAINTIPGIAPTVAQLQLQIAALEAALATTTNPTWRVALTRMLIALRSQLAILLN